MAWDEGYEVVNWSVDPNDWAGNAWSLPDLIEGRGPIILQHDRNFEAQVQDQALSRARKMGYQMVSLTECLTGKQDAAPEVPEEPQKPPQEEESKPSEPPKPSKPLRGRKPQQRPITRTPVVIKPPIQK